MQPLNAIDAISPAFTRVHQLLFAPFRMGRSWKLTASSYLAFCGSFFVPWPLFLFFAPRLGLTAHGILLLSLFGFITALSVLVQYFGARMELVEFEMLVTRQRIIAPMWRRYSQRVWPWIAVKVLTSTIMCALAAAIFYQPARNMFEALASMPQGNPADPQQLAVVWGSIFRMYAGMTVILLAIKLPSTFLADFAMPFYVLEDISIFAAIRRGLAVFAADPLQAMLYLILKPILFIVGYVLQYTALIASMLLVEVVFGIVVFIVYFAVGRHAGPVGQILLIAGAVVLGLCLAVIFTYAMIGSLGYLTLLFTAQAVYFMAGRYPRLDAMLIAADLPDPGTPFTPPPVFPSPEEREDDDGGPPFPMDPAVA